MDGMAWSSWPFARKLNLVFIFKEVFCFYVCSNADLFSSYLTVISTSPSLIHLFHSMAILSIPEFLRWCLLTRLSFCVYF